MTKQELRKEYLKKRKLLDIQEVSMLSDRIFDDFLQNFRVAAGMKIHIFLSISKFNEIRTQKFISKMQERGVLIFVPKMSGDDIVSIELQKDTKLAQNSWGIFEPEISADSGEKDFDYIITPLLYCDPSGNRVGYGKGFYDRFFADVKGTKVGVNFFEPDEIIDDTSSLDIPLDYLVTPAKVLSFAGL